MSLIKSVQNVFHNGMDTVYYMYITDKLFIALKSALWFEYNWSLIGMFLSIVF
jgi:hypothetical protein